MRPCWAPPWAEWPGQGAGERTDGWSPMTSPKLPRLSPAWARRAWAWAPRACDRAAFPQTPQKWGKEKEKVGKCCTAAFRSTATELLLRGFTDCSRWTPEDRKYEQNDLSKEIYPDLFCCNKEAVLDFDWGHNFGVYLKREALPPTQE